MLKCKRHTLFSKLHRVNSPNIPTYSWQELAYKIERIPGIDCCFPVNKVIPMCCKENYNVFIMTSNIMCRWYYFYEKIRDLWNWVSAYLPVKYDSIQWVWHIYWMVLVSHKFSDNSKSSSISWVENCRAGMRFIYITHCFISWNKI